MQKEKKGGFLWEMLFYGILLFLVFITFSFQIGRKNLPKLWGGYSCMLVLTESMGEAIPKGSFVLTKEMEAEQFAVGDDITFLANKTTAVTHRIVEKKKTEHGLVFRTKGIANKEPDNQFVSAENIVGKVVFHNLYLGKILLFVYKYGIPILLFLLAMMIMRFVLSYPYKM